MGKPKKGKPRPKRISLAYRELHSFPDEALERIDGIENMDLSNNELSNLLSLRKAYFFCNSVQVLILDHNRFNDFLKIPHLENLHTLSLNHNDITNLTVFINNLLQRAPRIHHLSLLCNQACPNYFNGGTLKEYVDYRLYVIARLKHLEYLDSDKVTPDERKEAHRLYSSVAEAENATIEKQMEEDKKKVESMAKAEAVAKEKEKEASAKSKRSPAAASLFGSFTEHEELALPDPFVSSPSRTVVSPSAPPPPPPPVTISPPSTPSRAVAAGGDMPERPSSPLSEAIKNSVDDRRVQSSQPQQPQQPTRAPVPRALEGAVRIPGIDAIAQVLGVAVPKLPPADDSDGDISRDVPASIHVPVPGPKPPVPGPKPSSASASVPVPVPCPKPPVPCPKPQSSPPVAVRAPSTTTPTPTPGPKPSTSNSATPTLSRQSSDLAVPVQTHKALEHHVADPLFGGGGGCSSPSLPMVVPVARMSQTMLKSPPPFPPVSYDDASSQASSDDWETGSGDGSEHGGGGIPQHPLRNPPQPGVMGQRKPLRPEHSWARRRVISTSASPPPAAPIRSPPLPTPTTTSTSTADPPLPSHSVPVPVPVSQVLPAVNPFE